MAIQTASFDKSKFLKVKARVNEAGVPIVITFLNEDGTAHDITTYDFEYRLRQSPKSDTFIWKLTIGDGLTISGAGNNKLNIAITAARATRRPDKYFADLYSADEDHTWLNIEHEFLEGTFIGADTDAELTVIENGTAITIQLQNAGTNDIDGGSAASVYLATQLIDGGGA